jgi:glycosyltransferase involved in cell wall biosynthesis
VNDAAFTRAIPGGEAVFLFGGIAMRRGGVTRAFLRRMRLYVDAGIKVRLLLTGHSHREDDERAAIWRAWGLPESIEVRYFWREAAPGGGGALADPATLAADEPGFTSIPAESAAGSLVRFYRDGLLAKTKHFDAAGGLERIDHHDPARRLMSREYFDVHERLVYIDEMNPETAKPTLRRWFDRSGRCWLTSWLNPIGFLGPAVQHEPTVAAYDAFGHRVALWIDDVLADADTPVVFADRRNQDHALVALTHPGARKVAVLHNCHTTKPYRAEDPPKLEYRPLLEHIDAFDAVVVLTHQQHDDLARHFGAPNLAVINHPTPSPPKLQAHLQPGLLVAIARLEPQKRLDHAIRAFARAARQVPEARFHIYGTGSRVKALKELAEKLGVTDHVQFRGFTDQPMEVFASASAVVLSSVFEGFPLVLTEAMAVGTPFVAYDINYGPAEVIRNGVDGLLVPPGDIEALAGAMVRVLGDPGYAARLGDRAREVVERFPERVWTAEWIELFTRLTAERRTTVGGAGAESSSRRVTAGEK